MGFKGPGQKKARLYFFLVYIYDNQVVKPEMHGMAKNIFLPLILIILTGPATIYCWFEDAPLSFVCLIGFITLLVGSMYIAYYISYALFPDKHNVPLPPFPEIIDLENVRVKWTRGNTLGTVLTIACWVGGVYGMIKLTDKYKNYHIQEYGRYAKAVVVEMGHSKGIREYAEYEFTDVNGKIYRDRCSRGILIVGDTINIIYSTQRPVINEVIRSALTPAVW